MTTPAAESAGAEKSAAPDAAAPMEIATVDATPKEGTPKEDAPKPTAATEAGSAMAAAVATQTPITASAAKPVTATPATQVAMVTPAEPENWLLGKWQGPAYGCPPGGGIEFTADHSFTYFKGQITVRLPVSYRVDPNSVTVTTVGSDGIAQDYVYQQTGPDSMIIVGIPPNMPRSLLGAAHRRCGAAPTAKPQQAALQAPVAVYPGDETSLQTATPAAVTPPAAYAQTAAPSASMAPLPAPPKTTTPASITPASAAPTAIAPAPVAPTPAVPATVAAPAESHPATPPVTEPVAPKAEAASAPEVKAEKAKTETPKAEATASRLPKSTTPASVADAQAKETKPTAGDAAPSAEPNASAENGSADGLVPVPSATDPAPAESSTIPTAEQQAAATPPAPTSATTNPATTNPASTAPASAAPASDAMASAEQKGWDALNAGNPDEALQIWEPLAKSGDTGLAVNVAGMYEFGQKLPQDYAKSAAWYRIAADQGDGYAQYMLGRAYTRGVGVPIDRVQAYKWLSLAMQSQSNETDKAKTGKASKVEIETALNDIVGAMSQSDMAKAAQMVKEYDAQHKTAD
jgi:hypothetical protein